MSIRAHLGACLAASIVASGCHDPMAYRFQGLAHYEGRRFLEVEGQFVSLTVAPAGDRVAFLGGGNVQGEDALYVAEIDGAVRRVASASTLEDSIAWAADGRSIFFLEYVTGADGMLEGAAVQQLTFATGAVRQVRHAGSPLAFFPSPDGARVLASGLADRAEPMIQPRRNHMFDVATGTSTPIAPSLPPVFGRWAGAWAPDGAHVAIAVPPTEVQASTVAIKVLASPAWEPGEAAGLMTGSMYAVMAWESAQVLRLANLVPDVALETSRIGTAGEALGTTRTVVDAPPDGTGYRYDRPVMSRDGRRVLVSRLPFDARTGRVLGPRAHAVFDDAGQHPLPAQEDLEAVGWLDDRRILFLNGQYQSRRPVILEAAP